MVMHSAGTPAVQSRATSDSRLVHVDIAKGMAMAAIVAIHDPLLLEHGGVVFNALLSFALPVFFICTGVFTEARRSVHAIAIARARTLIAPYASTIGIIASIQCVTSPRHVGATLSGAAYGTGATLVWVTLWFLPHLWLVSIAAHVLVKCIARCPMPAAISALVATGLLFIGTAGLHDMNANLGVLRTRGLPFSVDLLPISVAYALIGSGFRNVWLRPRFNPALFAMAAIAFILIQTRTDAGMDLNLRRYDSALWSSASALTGAYAVFLLATVLRKLRYAGPFIRDVGRASLVICIFHFAIQQALVRSVTTTPSVWQALALSLLVLVLSLAIWRCMSLSATCRLLFAVSARREPSAGGPVAKPRWFSRRGGDRLV